MPLAVWFLAGVQLFLGLGWGLLAPVFRAPDEPQHVDLALAVARGEPYPEAFERRVSAQVVAASQEGLLARDGTLRPDRSVRYTIEGATPRRARPSFTGLADDGPSFVANQMPQHPPLYYLLAGGALAVVPDATSWDVQVWLLRVVGAMLVAPLPIFAWHAATRVTRDRRVALTAAALPLAVPQLGHIAGAANNDAPLVLLVGAATVGIAAVAAGDLRVRTAALTGAVGGLALLTKGFALFFPLWAVAAYAVPAARRRDAGETLRPAVVGAAIMAGTALAIGGWWWVRNVVRYGTVQPDAFVRPGPPADFAPDGWWWVVHAASRIPLRFWGQPGWVEFPLPWVVVWLLTAAVVAAVVTALVALRPPAAGRRAALGVMLVPLGGILVIMLAGGWAMYARTSAPAGLQGRYLFPALAGLATVAATGGVVAARQAARWLPVGVLTTGACLQGYTAWLALRHWWGPSPPDAGAGLRALLVWAPLPPGGALAIMLGLGATALGAAVALLLASRQDPLLQDER